MQSDVPPDLRRFILTSIPSVPFLEAILLMRAARETAWTPALLAQRLYVPEATAAELLEALRAAGICPAVHEADCMYAPSTPELAELLDRVAAAYSANLVAVTDLIHSRIDKRAQQFADAFRWRKDT